MIRIFHIFTICVLISSSMILISNYASGEEPAWPTVLGNQQNNGRTEYTCGDEPPQFLWSLNLEGEALRPPLIDGDGNILITSMDRTMTCVYPNGTIKWRMNLDFYPGHTPAILSDGTIIMAEYSNRIHAYTRDGDHLWEHYSAVDHLSPVAVDGEDNIYIGGSDGILSISSDGEYRWNQVVNGDIRTPPCIDENGMIYTLGVSDHFGVSSGWDNIYSFNPDGTRQWSENIKGSGALMVLRDGRIFSAGRREITCVNADGTRDWTVEIDGGDVGTSAASDEDGNIYFIMEDDGLYPTEGTLYSCYPNGTIRWKVEEIGNDAYPIIDGDGRILLCNGHGIRAFSLNGSQIWRLPMFGENSHLLVHPDGMIFIAARGSMQLFCVGHGEETLPGKPLNVKGELSEGGAVLLTFELPPRDTYPFISRVNIYQKKENGDFERIETIDRSDDPWEWRYEVLTYRDYGLDVSVKQYFYITFENRLGEGEPSDTVMVFDETAIWSTICIGTVLGSTLIITVGTIIAFIVGYKRKKAQSTHSIK